MDFREIAIPFPEGEKAFSHLWILQNGSERQTGSYIATKEALDLEVKWSGRKVKRLPPPSPAPR
jgi:hypothetical protein